MAEEWVENLASLVRDGWRITVGDILFARYEEIRTAYRERNQLRAELAGYKTLAEHQANVADIRTRHEAFVDDELTEARADLSRLQGENEALVRVARAARGYTAQYLFVDGEPVASTVTIDDVLAALAALPPGTITESTEEKERG